MTLPSSSDALPFAARAAIESAKAETMSYAVEFLQTAANAGETPRALVILGEAHMKLGRASMLGQEVIRHFDLRGVETFQTKAVVCGRLLGVLVHFPRQVIRALSFGLVKDSTIVDAKALATGHTVELERTAHVPLGLHAASVYLTGLFLVMWPQLFLALFRQWFSAVAPTMVAHTDGASQWFTWITLAFEVHMLALIPAWFLRHKPWSFLVHPLIGIVGIRDTLMAEGTVRMFRDHKDAKAAVVIMGRAHVRGYARELVTRHGYTRG